MQCFQPQLAQFQTHSFEKSIERMKLPPDDPSFWIEEKLDGERMQLHMMEDDEIPGGKRFGFWSRKAKEYTYLYGEGFEDENAALTRHIKGAFDEGVRNLILDGEMITWDPEQDAVVPFGTLKTAALSEARNPFGSGQRPLFRVFDLLFLNDASITNYTLSDRRRALEACIKPIHRRLEVHTYQEAHSAAEIEPVLRQVVAEASEGLVLKNPGSMYRLNQRNDDWMKVKPEYMSEFGESLDCIVIGGYYGSGNRGGKLASFLCGLRVEQNPTSQTAHAMKCYSFFKVGGGFCAADYASVRHQTEDKWKDWDRKNPPTEYVELAGGKSQLERPDVWIRPDESIVLEVKAAQVITSDTFRLGLSLRFPRFKKIRMDKDWKTALSVQEFLELRTNVEKEHKEKEFALDESRRKRVRVTRKKSLVIAGEGQAASPLPGSSESTAIFNDLNFYIISDSVQPVKRSKVELEALVKAHGGKIFQTSTFAPDTICIADRRTVKAASLQKSGFQNIVRPVWIFDCIAQAEADAEHGRPSFLLPLEPRHMFFVTTRAEEEIRSHVDAYADSYTRDVSVDELREIFNHMPEQLGSSSSFDAEEVKAEFSSEGADLESGRGWLFKGVVAALDLPTSSSPSGADLTDEEAAELELRLRMAGYTLKFAGARVIDGFAQSGAGVSHVICGESRARTKSLRQLISKSKILPRLVTVDWVETSWKEGTFLDEERK